MATKSEFIRARIEPDLKHNVEKILDQLGLSQTKAIRLFYKMIILNKGLPFEVKIPNSETLKAIQNAENGIDIIECKDADDMFNKLEI